MAREAPIENGPAVNDVIATCALFHTRRAARAITSHFDRYLKTAGVKATHFSLLVVVEGAQGRPLSEIAAYMAMDRTALARDLRGLEELGLISIEAPPGDRRVRVMSLTSKGKRLLTRAMPMWRKAQDGVETAMSGRRWPHMLDGLTAATALGA